MALKKIATLTLPFAFAAYIHLVSPIAPEDSSGFLFNWIGISGVVGVSPTEAATI